MKTNAYHSSDSTRVVDALQATKTMLKTLGCVIAVLFVSLSGAAALAHQRNIVLPETPAVQKPYRLDFRILVRGSAAARVKDRDWSKLVQDAGYRVTIASDNGSDRLGIRNRETGRRTVVEIVGLVDRRGLLLLGKKQFRLGDAKPLKVFLDDLSKHGVEGPVRERPTWGLTISEYTEVLKLLAGRAPGEVRLSSPVQTMRAMNLPAELRVTWSSESRKVALSDQQDAGTIDLGRVSTGSGLAIAMAQFGLGFRAMKHPRSGYLLEIDVGDESSNLWPIGWKNKRPLTEVLPRFYQFVEVDLEDDKVEDVVNTIADRVELPWFCSHQRLAACNIDFSQIVYSTPPDQISPSGLLRSMGKKHRIRMEPRTDEGGQLFLWCTTVDDQAAWKKRFASVIPGKTE